MTTLNRHALDGHIVLADRQADHIEIVRDVAVATVLAMPGSFFTVDTSLHSEPGIDPRVVGPGEWLAVAFGTAPDGLSLRLSVSLTGMAFVSDQSGGRVLLRLTGPNVRRILAKGIGIDLDGMAVGASSNVLCGHIAVNLVRKGDDTFEVIVPRSFAESLFDDLLVMGREYALSAAFAA